MKNPKLRINKKIRIKAIRKLKIDLNEIVEDALIDIKWYLVKDIMDYLKKKGIIYAKKTSKKNKKKNKR